MAEDPNPTPVAPVTPPVVPVDNPPVAPVTPPTPPTPPANGTVDPAEFEKYKKDAEEYAEYKKKVNPVLETLWSDPELLKKATEIHNKRLGIATETPPGENPTTTPSTETDTRNAMVNQISDKFEAKRGIDKLPDDKKKEVRGLLGNMIKEMVDPKGNKTITQVFEEISLTKLDWYFERAFDLINRDEDIKAAIERGRSEILDGNQAAVGVMSSAPSSSIPIDSVTLTPAEKTAASRMGVSEEDYLKNKKAIITARS